MVRSASLLSQLMAEIPRSGFERLVRRHGGDYASKGFTCWDQLAAMLFCHLALADSLRDICNGLAGFYGKLSHVGVRRVPSKSNLSYANAHRPAELFEDVFWMLLDRFREQGRLGRRMKAFRFKNKLLSLDSTTVSLCLSLFPWASFRRAKGGAKLHVLLDHDDYMPSYVRITKARAHDSTMLKHLRLNQGSIVTMDMAYNDYRQFGQWTREGVYFVTRMKSNAKYTVIERRTPPKRSNVLADEIIRLTGIHAKVCAQKKCPYDLRRGVVWNEDRQRELVLLTNHLDFGATTIGAIYKERWQIEIFFKTLKQNLKIKSFVGTSENALRIQIWTALIALLQLKWLHHLSGKTWSLKALATMLRFHLFTYRSLREWLDNPFGPSTLVRFPDQLNFGFT